MRFTTATIATLLALASASPIANGNSAGVIDEIDGVPVVDLDTIQSHDARDISVADVVVPRGNVESDKSLEVRAWPHDHQSGIFKAGHGYAARVVTGLVINGVNVAVTAWLNDVHTIFLKFDPAFPNTPNYVWAGFEDVATGLERQPWRITWDNIYSLTVKAGERVQFDNNFVMWWK